MTTLSRVCLFTHDYIYVCTWSYIMLTVVVADSHAHNYIIDELPSYLWDIIW